MIEDTFYMHTVDDAEPQDVTITTTASLEADPTATPLEGEVIPATEPVESGLMRQVIVNDDARTVRRAVAILLARGAGTLMICGLCREAKRQDICQWGRKDDTGELVLACSCTGRVLEGVRK